MHNIISNMKTRIDPDDNRHRGFKFKIYPNEKQKKIIHRNFIGAHYAYNRALDYFIEYEDTYKDIPEDVKIDKGIIFTSERDMYSKFVKPDMDNDPNVENPTVSVIRSAIHNFYQAIDNYRNIPGYNRPRYKTAQSRMSYTFKADNLNITGDSIRIEGIPDHIPCENIGDRLPLKLSSGNVKYGVLKFCIPTISFDGTNYWFGVSVQYPGVITRISSNLSERTKAIGIDVGLNTTATCSNGMIFHTPMGDKHRKRLKRLRKRANKHYYKPMLEEARRKNISFHDIEKSKNLRKLEASIRKLTTKISKTKDMMIHNFANSLVRCNPDAIVMETFSVEEMAQGRNSGFCKKLYDQKLYTVKDTIQRKCYETNIPFILASKSYPSTQRCCNCGYIKTGTEKLNKKRTYICPVCGLSIDRDANAANNLEQLAYNQDLFDNISEIYLNGLIYYN